MIPTNGFDTKELLEWVEAGFKCQETLCDYIDYAIEVHGTKRLKHAKKVTAANRDAIKTGRQILEARKLLIKA